MISVLDLTDSYLIDGYVVFHDGTPPHRWYVRWLKRGFRHVEMWQLDRGVWVLMNPSDEVPVLQAFTEHPTMFNRGVNPTFVRVQKRIECYTMRPAFMVGMLSCVTAIKLALGIRNAPWVLTPYGLYKYLTRRKEW